MQEIKSDIERIKAMRDEDIDYSDIPPLDDDAIWERAVLKRPGERPGGQKVQTTIRFSPEVLEFFKEQGPGYQTRMDQVLLRHVRRQKAKKKKAA